MKKLSKYIAILMVFGILFSSACKGMDKNDKTNQTATVTDSEEATATDSQEGELIVTTMDGQEGVPIATATDSQEATVYESEMTSFTNYREPNAKPPVESISVVSETAYNGCGCFTGNPRIQVGIVDTPSVDSVNYRIMYNKKVIEKTEVIDADITDAQGIVWHEISINNEEGIVEDGHYTVSVVVFDKAGEWMEAAFAGFVVDNTKPEFSAFIRAGTMGGKHGREDGTDQYYSSDVEVAIWAIDDYITEREITITDNGQKISVPTLLNGKGFLTVSGEGSHTITISGKDKAGNEGISQSVWFIIDKTKPQVSMRVNGADYSEARGRINSLTDTTVDFIVSEENPDNTDNTDHHMVVTRRLPGQENESCSYQPTSAKSLSFSEDGDYTVSFYAVDQAGNKSDVRTAQFRIDKNAP